MNNDNDITEGKALDEWPEVEEGNDYALDQLNEAYDQLTTQLHEARHAEVGATIQCAQCRKRIVKKTYHKVFCSNARTHGRKNCKDLYHNRVKGLRDTIKMMDMDDY